MKKILLLFLAFIICLSLCACGDEAQLSNTEEESRTIETTEAEPEKLATVWETAHCSLEGIYVDNGYVDDDNASLKMVYVCYTVSTADQNLKVSAKYSDLTFESGNTYESGYNRKAVCDYLPNYYSTNYLEELYIGDSLQVVCTFLVPYAEFNADGVITVHPNGIPSEEVLSVMSDEVEFFDSAEELAQSVDPEGYAEILALHEPADEETCNKVKEAINGYYWSCYVNSTSYEVEFWAPNNFEVRVRALNVANGGTYTIQKGYIVCTYDDNGDAIEIPYSWEDGEINLDCVAAFDINS